MSDHFRLRLTNAGRAALADGANRGTNAVRYTHIAIGSGSGPGGDGNDARTTLRSERDRAAVEGTTEVAGEIAICAFVSPTASYSVREIGLFGRVGDSGPEKLHAYWTDETDIFAAASTGTQVIVAGKLAIGPLAAGATLNVTASVTLQSQGLMPLYLLPFPHADTADRRLTVTGESSARGGRVSVTADQKLSLGQATPTGDTAFIQALRTAAWRSPELAASATYFLRAQVSAAGDLTLYVQRGTDADAAPSSLRGEPNGAGGGGFPSTVLDARIARIATGSGVTAPTIVRYVLDARPRPGIAAWSAAEDYPHPSAAWGSDAALYKSVRSSGPTHGGAVNPTTDADRSHWRPDRISGAPSGTPAKNDLLAFADVSASGDPDRTVQVQHLLKALGAVADGRRYVLEGRDGALRLAEARFRMKRLSTTSTPSGHAAAGAPGTAPSVGGESAWLLPRAGRFFVHVAGQFTSSGSLIGVRFGFRVGQAGGDVGEGAGLVTSNLGGGRWSFVASVLASCRAEAVWIAAVGQNVTYAVTEIGIIEF